MQHICQTFVEDLSDKVKTNPKTLWGFCHDKTKSKSLPDRPTLTDSDSEYTEPAGKAKVVNIYFSYVCAKDQSPSIEFHYLGVKKIYSGLDAYIAYGPDNLPSPILKECANVLSSIINIDF